MREFINSPPVFIEITPGLLRVLRENGGLELPLERTANGKLTDDCHEKTAVALQQFLGRKSWQPRGRAICGISLYGVSLRKITLPVASGDELERVLRLQIENEFPLSPEELAWGWREISRDADKLEAVVVAIRKEAIQDYDHLLSAAGLNPEFTVAAVARNVLVPTPDETHAILEITRNYSELAWFKNGVPASLKILPTNGEVPDSILKIAEVKTLYVSGTAVPGETFEKLSTRTDCRRLEISGGDGVSAATLGLKKSVAENISLLRLQTKRGPSKAKFNFSQLDFSPVETRRWLIRAGVLLVLLLIFPFAESLLLKPLLVRKLETLKAERQRFVAVVGPEMQFLQSLKQSQPPYLDTIYIFSKAAPPGLHLDSISLNQHGDITIKATVQTAQQLMDFRSSLIGSGFFANITVEDQSPVPNQPKVNVRMTAQWKSAAARAGLKIDPLRDQIGKSTAGAAATPGDGKIPPT